MALSEAGLVCVCASLAETNQEKGRRKERLLSLGTACFLSLLFVFLRFTSSFYVNKARGKEEDSGAECLFIAALELGGD